MSNLTAQEICSILGACGAAGVAELKFGDLQVSFHRPVEAQMDQTPPVYQPEAAISEIHAAQEIEKSSIEQEEFDVKTERLALMMVEDPAQYEKLFLDGELTDAEPQDR